MSNLTSGSIEYFPIISNASKPNRLFRHAIIGEGNSVSSSAQDIIVNGSGNFIGDECRSINLLNTSSCIVSSGVIGVNLFSCSGLTVNDSDTIFIKNIEITDSSFLTSGVTYSQSYNIVYPSGQYNIMLSDYTVDVSRMFPGGAMNVVLPAASGHTQEFNIKNSNPSAPFDVTVDVTGADTIDRVNTFIIISVNDSLTVQSNGSNGYIIL
jgi:hypothetical protein